jgi:hypothetical protein
MNLLLLGCCCCGGAVCWSSLAVVAAGRQARRAPAVRSRRAPLAWLRAWLLLLLLGGGGADGGACGRQSVRHNNQHLPLERLALQQPLPVSVASVRRG